jgi:hypothetical protein
MRTDRPCCGHEFDASVREFAEFLLLRELARRPRAPTPSNRSASRVSASRRSRRSVKAARLRPYATAGYPLGLARFPAPPRDSQCAQSFRRPHGFREPALAHPPRLPASSRRTYRQEGRSSRDHMAQGQARGSAVHCGPAVGRKASGSTWASSSAGLTSRRCSKRPGMPCSLSSPNPAPALITRSISRQRTSRP